RGAAAAGQRIHERRRSSHDPGSPMSRVEAFRFAGPAGALEGLWKPGDPPHRGSAVFAHPHPLHGGTLHNKVVFRAARALTSAGFDTLRFIDRGTGAVGGRLAAGLGEQGDVRAAVDEAIRRGGTPTVAGGFSFVSAVGLSAIAGNPRVAAFIGVGLPVASYADRSW